MEHYTINKERQICNYVFFKLRQHSAYYNTPRQTIMMSKITTTPKDSWTDLFQQNPLYELVLFLERNKFNHTLDWFNSTIFKQYATDNYIRFEWPYDTESEDAQELMILRLQGNF